MITDYRLGLFFLFLLFLLFCEENATEFCTKTFLTNWTWQIKRIINITREFTTKEAIVLAAVSPELFIQSFLLP